MTCAICLFNAKLPADRYKKQLKCRAYYGVDPQREALYIYPMSKNQNKTIIRSVSSDDIQRLEVTVSELIDLCERMQQENSRLRNDNLRMKAESAAMIKRNDVSRKRMEAIVTRLKAMELEI